MGAGWISELLATLTTQPEWLWSIVDLFNELQGVFIFLILIFKPKLYYLIRKRLGKWRMYLVLWTLGIHDNYDFEIRGKIFGSDLTDKLQ